MYETRKKEKIKACIAIGIIILAILITGIIVMKYNVEGDTNAPFKLAKLTVVSTAEGVENESTQEKWNLSIAQNNDMYFSIEKNEYYREEEIIDSVSIENIRITSPKEGKVKIYMPNSGNGEIFKSSDEFEVLTGNLTYKGAQKSNSKTLEIGNQGGTIVVRIANTNIGNYISNEDEEIKHDGSILGKIGKKEEDIKFSVTFDLVINLKNKKYLTNISLDFPCEENLIDKGTVSKEIKDEFIFKRARE